MFDLRVLWVNFHICWNGACVKYLTNIMSVATWFRPYSLPASVNRGFVPHVIEVVVYWHPCGGFCSLCTYAFTVSYIHNSASKQNL